MLDIIHKNFLRKAEWFLAYYLCQKGSSGSGRWAIFLWFLDEKTA